MLRFDSSMGRVCVTEIVGGGGFQLFNDVKLPEISKLIVSLGPESSRQLCS